METIREKMKKIAALAASGHEGERMAAEDALARLSKRHGISIDDLLDDQTFPVRFPVRGLEKDLFGNVLVFILQTRDVENRSDSQATTVWLTKAQAVDVKAAWTHYRAEWKKAQADALIVFVHKNSIFGPPTKGSAEPEPKTPEELAELRRLARQVNAATSAAPFRKTLENSKP